MVKKCKRINEAKELLKDIGMDLPIPEREITGIIAKNQMLSVIKFAMENDLVIHPMGYSYYVDGFNEFKHCPCDSSRPKCPCDEAADEVRTNGKCKCQLFWLDYETYINTKL